MEGEIVARTWSFTRELRFVTEFSSLENVREKG